MSITGALLSRVVREIEMLSKEPPPGISCWPVGDSMTDFEAIIIGADDTPYEKGEFKVSLTLPLRYPMEPPRCRFITKVYHPNIDEGGRICLDTLVMPPKGSWKPSLNLSTVLMSLRLLLSSPNPEDPLVADISEQFQFNYPLFAQTAAAYTKKYATISNSESLEEKSEKKDAAEQMSSSKQNQNDPITRNALVTEESSDEESEKESYTEDSKLNNKKRSFEEVQESKSSSSSNHQIDVQAELQQPKQNPVSLGAKRPNAVQLGVKKPKLAE